MSVQLAQYRELYFSEAREQIGHIADALRKLERAPGDRIALKAAFRAAHTLKGMSATMGYDEVTVFSHALEDLLQSLREHRGSGPTALNYTLFRTLDYLDGIVGRLESGQSSEAEMITVGEQLPIPAPPSNDPVEGTSGQAPSLVRVTSGQLDQLTALIIRLVANAQRLGRGQAKAQDDARSTGWREHLSLLAELEATAWSLQMAPIGQVFDRFPQMLHGLARAQGKEIRFKLEGGESEVWRGLLEEVHEPLLHLLRNAVAHGIESPAERLKAGKDPRGTILLRAYPCGELITIEVGDDGRGLDTQRILQVAIEQGFVPEAARKTLSEAEAYDLITLPGFSLAPVVTNVSGRGVGMDIVRAKVEALRGSMRIRSQPGLGTTFILEFPRSYGAVEVELVRVGDQIYRLPAAQVETARAPGRDNSGPPTGESNLPKRAIRVIDLRSSLHLPPRRDSEPYELLMIRNRGGTAVSVDELLGKVLWSTTSNGDAPLIPLLDLDQIVPA